MYRSGAIMAWNVFKLCTALRELGFVMILVLAVVRGTYYTVVVANYGPVLLNGSDLGLGGTLTAVAVLVLFRCLLTMLLWSYFTVVVTDPGSVPPNWRPVVDERGEAVPLTGSEFGNPALGLQQSSALVDPENPRVTAGSATS